jgi:hypothetical protein
MDLRALRSYSPRQVARRHFSEEARWRTLVPRMVMDFSWAKLKIVPGSGWNSEPS